MKLLPKVQQPAMSEVKHCLRAKVISADRISYTSKGGHSD